MINIIFGYSISRLEGTIPAELITIINEELRYRPEGYERTWNFKTGKSDGYIYLFNVLDKSFRSGLLARVVHVLNRQKFEYKIYDIRKQRDTKISDLSKLIDLSKININPFEYQNKAASITSENIHSVIASQTGTGKTVMMALMAKLHSKRTLVVVNSRVLLDQAYEFFDQIIPGRVGIIGSGDFELNDITIATIQSIGSILGTGKKRKPTANAGEFQQWLDNVGLIIHDEVHEADSNTTDEFYGSARSDCFVGTTATPYSWAFSKEKNENLEMEQHFGVKCYDSRKEVDFIKLGITVPLIIRRLAAPIAPQFVKYLKTKLDVRKLEYKDVLDQQVVNHEERTNYIAKEVVPEIVKSGKSCYIYYNRITYGQKLCDALSDFDPVMLQGETSRQDRKKCFEDLEKKRKLVVVSDLGSYGLNIKTLDSIVLAFGSRDARQLCGRVCRAAPNKKYGYVYDIFDEVPMLKTHAKLREAQYKEAGHTLIG